MKLLMVIDSLGSGGAQRQFTILARGLAQRGHQVEVALYYPQYDHFAPQLAAQNIPIHALPKRSRFDVNVPFALRRLIKQHDYDLVLAFLNTPSFYAELATWGTKTPLIVSERKAYPPAGLTLRAKIQKSFHRVADALVVNSHVHAKQVQKQFPSFIKTLHVITNAVDTEKFAPSNAAKDEKTFLALGTVIPRKNVDGLIYALMWCRDLYNVKFKVRWAGKRQTDATSQQYAQQCDALIAKHNLEDQWEWLGERTDVAKLLASASALIHPAHLEGFPNAICEALASGVPVLASNFGDHPMLVQEPERGSTFDPKQDKEISAAMMQFSLGPTESREKMAANARQFALSELSIDAFIGKYEKLFTQVLDKYAN